MSPPLRHRFETASRSPPRRIHVSSHYDHVGPWHLAHLRIPALARYPSMTQSGRMSSHTPVQVMDLATPEKFNGFLV